MGKLLRNIFLAANILLVLLTLGAYVAPYVSPESNSLLPILGLGYPALLFCNILSIVLWMILRSRWAFLSFITMIVGYQSCTTLFNMNRADAPSAATFKVASYNANFAKRIALLAGPDKALAEKENAQFLKSHDDLTILCVQEDGLRTRGYFEALDFEYSWIVEEMTVSIYSKFPIIEKGMIDLESTTANTCLWADIALPSGKVRVYTTHLEANRPTAEVPEVIIETAPEEMSNSTLVGILQHHVMFSTIRAKQAQTIANHAQSSPYPTIICGDLNETPQSYVYTILKGDRQDTFQEEGQGMASTFGEKIPALRIDHIFVDNTIEVLHHEISPNVYSDHYMIVGELELRRNEN